MTDSREGKGDNRENVQLRRVIDELPGGFEGLRSEALGEGFQFLDRLAADWDSRVMRFDGQGEQLLAVYANNSLAGVGGLTIEPVVVGALRMRRFYVRSAFRRGGLGQRLATSLIERSAPGADLITVNASAGSFPFWESLGFVPDAIDGHTHVRHRLYGPAS